MDTNRIKHFATEARNILKAGIAAKILSLGFDQKGNVAEGNMPQLMQGGSVWNGQLQTEGFYRQWMALYNRIRQIGIKDVYEEAAYTWFNRLCAIRILQKNNLCSPVLAYADAAHTPIIVDEARQGRIPQMKEELRQRLMELLDDDTKVTEQFAILITAWCHDNPIIQQCFGGIADYTELLLPNNILAEGGFVDLINNTDFITDEDFQSPELIGWLYQFYISERKDEVFAKKGKFEADEIPAATQIFTPNWIVKYMVQNTVGRIYLDNNPYETQLQKKWQYLVEPTEKSSEDSVLKYDELTDLKVADLACGSGHILNECFDLLYDLYIAEGYSRTEAIESIFNNNLTGVDLDARAKQLATFALLLKACQKDSAFADAHSMPNVLTMPKPWNSETQGPIQDMLNIYFQGEATNQQKEEIMDCFDLMQDADSLGSIMKFDISESTHLLIKQITDYWCSQEIVPEKVCALIYAFKLILTLTEKYHALVMNPPYMKATNMNSCLKNYVSVHYESVAMDLYSTFMLVAMNKINKYGKISMIVQPTWLVNSSFTSIRTYMLSKFNIDSLLHMGRGNFGNDWGSIAFTLSEGGNSGSSIFFKLYERTFYRIETEHICVLFRKAMENYDFKFKFKDYSATSFVPQNSIDGNRIVYNCTTDKFKKIKNCPFCYTFSDEIIDVIRKTNIANKFNPATGLQTGNNNRFIRTWFETSSNDMNIKWFPLVNGGDYRKWYGNFVDLIYWYNNGEDIKNCKSSVLRNQQYYLQAGISWNRIASRGITLRAFPQGCLFDQAGDSMFSENMDELLVCMAYLNTKVAKTFFDMLAPTLNLTAGMIGRLPYKDAGNSIDILSKCKECIEISKLDWDAHETSWNFQRNELLLIDEQAYEENVRNNEVQDCEETNKGGDASSSPQFGNLVWRMEQYKQKWKRNFMQLHKNEEELNRRFIGIYGLQDELTPEVPLKEITILQQGEMKITDQYNLSDNDGSIFTDSDGAVLTVGGESYLDWQDDVIIKQLISYAVGCMLGRYRLDKPGLHIAHPNPTEEEIAPYEYNDETWEIDDDGIMPLMANDCGFSDNASVRFSDFIRVALGNEKHVENLNFVEECLGKPIEQYFVKDFWKDHKKMYQNRPIYWLFSSKKGAFQVIAYMHRMNAYTVERVRAKYLLPYIEHLQAEFDKLDARRAELTTKESKQLQTLQKQLDECREYHERLQVVAEQAISFDLDDGVVVNYAKFGDVLQKIK